MPVVRTDGRAYGHVVTKFSRMGRLLHFLTHGAPLRALRARAPLLHCKHSRFWSVSLIQEDDITQFLFCEQYVWIITRPFIRGNHWIALHCMQDSHSLQVLNSSVPRFFQLWAELVTENQSTRLQRTLNKIDKVGNFKSDLLKTNKDTAMQSRGILQTFVLYCGEHVPAFKLG